MASFKDCIKIEEKGREKFGNSFAQFWKDWNLVGGNIQRYIYKESEESTQMQLDDVDLRIGPYLISEKYRTSFFGDILVELLSNIDRRKVGWGTESRADYLFYFSRDFRERKIRCVVVKMDLVRAVAREIMNSEQKFLEKYITSSPQDAHWNNVSESGREFHMPPTMIAEQVKWRGLCASVRYDEIAKFQTHLFKQFEDIKPIDYYICNYQEKTSQKEESYSTWTPSEPFNSRV